MLATDHENLVENWMAQTRVLINTQLETLLPSTRPSPVTEAMRYSVLAPGKRIRPLLTLAVTRFLGATPAGVMHVACAIEMIHSASLILDDLPCMDNDNERRNRLSTHVMFGEDLSILAAVSLLMQSHCMLASQDAVEPDVRLKLIQLLCETIGPNGLSLGQYIDLNPQARLSDAADITDIHHLKTGVLFVAAAKAGCLLCSASPKQEEKILRFTTNIGLAFQLMDDLVDQDEERPNLAARIGVSNAERKFLDYLQAANDAIEGEANAAVLQDFLRAVFKRV